MLNAALFLALLLLAASLVPAQPRMTRVTPACLELHDEYLSHPDWPKLSDARQKYAALKRGEVVTVGDCQVQVE